MFCHIGIMCDRSGNAGSQMICNKNLNIYDNHTNSCVSHAIKPTCTNSTTRPDLCASIPCQNNGICIQGKYKLTYSCKCINRYRGNHCHIGELSKCDLIFISKLLHTFKSPFSLSNIMFFNCNINRPFALTYTHPLQNSF